MIPIWLLLVQLIIYVSLNLIPSKQTSTSSRSGHMARIPAASNSIASWSWVEYARLDGFDLADFNKDSSAQDTLEIDR